MPREGGAAQEDAASRNVFPDYIRIPAIVVDTAGVEHPVTLTLPVSGYGYHVDGKIRGAVALGEDEATFQYEEGVGGA